MLPPTGSSDAPQGPPSQPDESCAWRSPPGTRGLWLHRTALSEREKTAIMDIPLSLSGLFGEEAMAALEESMWRGAPTYQARGAPRSPKLKLQHRRQLDSYPA